MITDNLGYVSFCADIYGTGVTDLSAAALEHLNDPTLYYNKILGMPCVPPVCPPRETGQRPGRARCQTPAG